jgi:Ca2+/Na+ antiporter
MAPHTERIYWILPAAMFIAGLASGGLVKPLAPALLWLAAGGCAFYWLSADASALSQSPSVALKVATVIPLVNVLALGAYVARTRRDARVKALAALVGLTVYAVAANMAGWHVAKRWLA